MLLTPHLLVGAAIASKISNPFLALPLAFLSHYFFDLIPHDDYSIINIGEKRWNKSFFDFFKVFLDILVGIFLISLFSHNNPMIFAAAFLAIVPDGITMFDILFPQNNKLVILHQNLHMAVNNIGDRDDNKKITLFWAIASQIAVILIAIFLLR